MSHEEFTGEDGCEDDEVDGAVAAHDLLALPVATLGEPAHAVAAGRDEWQDHAARSAARAVSEWD